MTNNHVFPLSPKYIDFVNSTNVYADFLEGTSASGKTTVGAGVKFMRMVSKSTKKLHVLAAKTVGVAEKNIINQNNGILDLHKNAQYFGNGDKENKIAHIKFEGKIIYVVGYDNKDKWKLILGGQYGCVYIDEINTADIEFVREISIRNDYMLATLNPDDSTLPVYKEFINRSRPYKKYTADIPPEIMAELTEPPVPGWKYWFFSFSDNASLTHEQIEKKKRESPPGTKNYKNKILGLRGRASGQVFAAFRATVNVITPSQAKKYKYQKFICGVDTAYSSKSPDTISFIFLGITTTKKVIALDEQVENNAEKEIPIAPSDTIIKLIKFLDKNKEEWGFCRDVFIDCADQGTITEARKYKREHPCLYLFAGSYKKIKIIDRIEMMNGWLYYGDYLVVNHCTEHIRELETYSWLENKDIPEDRNDHTINASQYGWIPYRDMIGNGDERRKGEV